ncbi:MAG: hypothetical protein Q7K42_01155, partial [Candidatus Diapherotrites archaeon]|nr:hypothetical protein [Candidatus Diapherotrites archaeon]
MQILDTTLREGEQTRGVSFTFEQKKQIVETLDSFGVDIIELGHPVVSPNIKKAVKNLAKLKLHAETMAHARANLKDIDEAVDCGVDWVGIFISTSNIGIKTKYNYSKEQILEKITESVEYAKSRGLKVRYTPEDGTRTERDYLLQAIHAGKKADRISIVDTVGTMTPSKFHELVKFVIKKSGKDLNVHCHNDFGLATANSLAAFEAGAKLSDVTINGLGERVGITPLSELTMALSQLHGVKKDW